MTRIEKETVISALGAYRDQQMRKANRERKNLEYGMAAKAQAEANKAHTLISVFCELLTVPAGEAKI